MAAVCFDRPAAHVVADPSITFLDGRDDGAVVELLDDGDWDVRRRALECLRATGASPDEIGEALTLAARAAEVCPEASLEATAEELMKAVAAVARGVSRGTRSWPCPSPCPLQ